MTRLLIKGGTVVDPASGLNEKRDVLLEDGRVAAVEPSIEAGDAEVFDASGKIVAPGFLDIHVHLREPGIEHAETIETGSRAAAAGGFTSICCMPNTIPVNDSPTVTNFIVERARRYAAVNVFPIGAITKGSEGEQLAEIGAMKAAGAVAISDDGMPVMNSAVMRRANLPQVPVQLGLALPLRRHLSERHHRRRQDQQNRGDNQQLDEGVAVFSHLPHRHRGNCLDL
jgi:dihydroorotase